MSTMMNTIDPSVIYAPPTIDDLPSDILPDPEGYYDGQEEHGYDANREYDYDDNDIYEPEVFSYDSY